MIRIESKTNNVFKDTKKLLTRSGRKKSDTFLLEGERLVEDAYKKGADIRYIIISEDYQLKTDFGSVRIYTMSSGLFDELKSTVNSQGIIAVAGYDCRQREEIDFTGGIYLYLDSVTDPGNMGTIIRSADAFGIDGIVLSGGCVDVYNPKVLRSTMSGIFNVKLYFDDGGVLADFRDRGFEILGTFPDGAASSREFSYSDKTVIVMGNEANGICPETEALCTHRVTIPMPGNAESLNVSVACAIMLYEVMLNIKG